LQVDVEFGDDRPLSRWEWVRVRVYESTLGADLAELVLFNIHDGGFTPIWPLPLVERADHMEDHVMPLLTSVARRTALNVSSGADERSGNGQRNVRHARQNRRDRAPSERGCAGNL
jgi:hypothetical protein